MALSKEEMGVPHPDLNALAAFIDGRLSEDDRTAVIVHVSDCLECRSTLAAHARGQVPATAQDGTAAGHRSRWLFRPAVWLPIAATLALVTTTAVMMWRIDPGTAQPSAAIPVAPEVVPPRGETRVPAAPDGGTPAQAKPPSPSVAPSSSKQDPLSTRRGADRVVNGKTFRLVAGEWIDAAYDPLALLPVQDIVGSDARSALLERMPALAQYAALGPRIIVTHEGVVYRFR